MKKYVISNKPGDFVALGAKYNIDPLVAKIMVNRGLGEEDFEKHLNPSYRDLHDPHLLRDVDRAVDIIRDAVNQNKKIRIIGDYDIDGVNATYILIKGLRRIGATVDYAIPDRIEDGYGINPRLVESAINDGIGLIITCDNGVSAVEAFKAARAADVQTIITDHHELMYEETERGHREILPDVDALVNPKREGDRYPFKGICGATVAWKLIICLYEACGIDGAEADEYIEYVAFATIGDVMQLVDENRAIVHLGLKAINDTKNIGLKALINKTMDGKTVTAYHIGFVIGPCENASGRLDTAAHAVELLLCEDVSSADEYASKLVELNNERKSMTEEATDKALALAKDTYADDKVLVIYIEEIHESICGIVAGRVREATDKPTIVLTKGADKIKGSARSIDAYNMYEKLHECRDMFSAFGGHPMAAGLTLANDGIMAVETLRQRLNENCNLSFEDLVSKEVLDGIIPLEYLSVELIEQLSVLEPYGNGNKRPLFGIRDVSIRGAKYIGREGNYMKLSVAAQNQNIDALFFKDASVIREKIIEKFGEEAFDNMMRYRQNPVQLSLVYYPSVNEYNGFKNVQIIVEDIM